jgi:nucleotide-binding universal stress UspA family protein
LERVVVPISFTPESEHAIPVAVALASKAHAIVDLLAVVEPIDRDAAEVKLTRIARDTGDAVQWRVLESGGRPEAALLTELHRRDRSLWCVGSHSRGALGELLLGSLSEELVRDAHEPVLLVGPHAGKPSEGSVLAVALDGTPRSEAILPAAIDLGRDLGMKPRLLEVIDADEASLPPDVSPSAYLARVATRLRPEEVDHDVLHGHDAGRPSPSTCPTWPK